MSIFLRFCLLFLVSVFKYFETFLDVFRRFQPIYVSMFNIVKKAI